MICKKLITSKHENMPENAVIHHDPSKHSDHDNPANHDDSAKHDFFANNDDSANLADNSLDLLLKLFMQNYRH